MSIKIKKFITRKNLQYINLHDSISGHFIKYLIKWLNFCLDIAVSK